jgi:hypothetical protein
MTDLPHVSLACARRQRFAPGRGWLGRHLPEKAAWHGLGSAEKLKLFEEVAGELSGRATVVAGSGDNCTADSVELSRDAARTGVDALLLTAPYYNRPTQEGMYRHFAAIAEAVELPCIPQTPGHGRGNSARRRCGWHRQRRR